MIAGDPASYPDMTGAGTAALVLLHVGGVLLTPSLPLPRYHSSLSCPVTKYSNIRIFSPVFPPPKHYYFALESFLHVPPAPAQPYTQGRG